MTGIVESIEIEHEETKTIPTFGEIRIRVIYLMKHNKRGRINRYRINCDVLGIKNHDLHLCPYSAEYLGSNVGTDTNDETLTERAAMGLFEENI